MTVAEPSAPAPVATSGPDTGDVFVHGRVLRDGNPVSDASVSAMVSPEDDDTEVGEVVDTLDVPEVRTDEDGRYALRLDPAEVPGKYVGSSGYVNFELLVDDREVMAIWNTTVWLVGNDSVWRSDEQDRTGDSVLELSVDLTDETVTQVDSSGERTREPLPVWAPS